MTFSSFLIDLCIILWKMLPDFAKVMNMCSPPSVGSTFSKNDFCPYRVQDHVSIPKLASKSPLFGGAFPPCAVQKIVVFADWAENGSPGMLSFASLLISCILDRIFERNKHHSMPQWCKRGSLSAFPRSLLQEHPLKLQCTRGHLLPLFTSVSAAFESALFTGRTGRSCIASAKTSVRSSMRSS